MYVIVFLVLPFVLAVGGTVQKLDMNINCGNQVSLGSSASSGIDVLMYMNDPASRSSCQLHITKNRDTEQLHFYFSEIDMPSCQDISLHIETGTSSLTPYTGLPSVCGSSSQYEVNRHYLSTERYLDLNVTWSRTTSVRGTVFRFIANIFTCDDDCPTADQCDNGWCLSPDLISEKNYDFCPDVLGCTDVRSADEKNQAVTYTNYIYTAVALGIFVLVTFCMFRSVKNFRNGGSSGRSCIRDCLEGCVECTAGVLACCFRGIRDCMRATCDKMRDCMRSARDGIRTCYRSLKDCLCKRETPPETTDTQTSATAATSTTTMEMATNTEPPPNAPPAEYDTSLDESSEAESEGAPPSYTAAMAMPTIPTAPPSYDVAVDTPPEYGKYVANEKFYEGKK